MDEALTLESFLYGRFGGVLTDVRLEHRTTLPPLGSEEYPDGSCHSMNLGSVSGWELPFPTFATVDWSAMGMASSGESALERLENRMEEGNDQRR